MNTTDKYILTESITVAWVWTYTILLKYIYLLQELWPCAETMVKYTLFYFDARGRAETARMLFKLAGVEFTDERYSQENWPKVKGCQYLNLFIQFKEQFM